jgi:UDP-3-O-[3-hydroxymyristoyl] glucosamine N-acyltransferase
MSPAAVSPTALVEDGAVLGVGVSIGHFAVVEAGAVLGDGCRVGHHAVVRAGSKLGADVRLDEGAVVGKRPMRAARSATTGANADLPPAEIGDGTLIGAYAVVYAGCQIGQRVLVADGATVREDVTVGDETIVGRGVAVENGCRVGARCKLETNAYLAAFTTVEDDVFVAPGVLTSNDAFLARTEARRAAFGGPTIRRSARIGVGAVILPGREVESEAVVGAGAVLTRDAEAERVHMGVPARDVRAVGPEQLRRNGG